MVMIPVALTRLRRTGRLAVLLGGMAALSGCVTDLNGLALLHGEAKPAEQEAPRSMNDLEVIAIDGEDAFPDARIDGLFANGIPLGMIVSALLKDSPIATDSKESDALVRSLPVRFEDGVETHTTSISLGQASLRTALMDLAFAAAIHVRMQNGTLVFSRTRSFQLQAPQGQDLANGLSASLVKLGAEDVSVKGNRLSFRADPAAERRVRTWLAMPSANAGADLSGLSGKSNRYFEDYARPAPAPRVQTMSADR